MKSHSQSFLLEDFFFTHSVGKNSPVGNVGMLALARGVVVHEVVLTLDLPLDALCAVEVLVAGVDKAPPSVLSRAVSDL